MGWKRIRGVRKWDERGNGESGRWGVELLEVAGAKFEVG
jgi:hypothetical protein